MPRPPLIPLPQDIVNRAFVEAIRSGFSGIRNFYRGLRGTVKKRDFFTGQVREMSPRERLVHDLRKKKEEFFAGAEIERDVNGNIVPKRDHNGEPIYKRRIVTGIEMVNDAVFGSMAIGLGWATKMSAGAATAVGVTGLKGAGHVAYQSYGLVRDFTIGGAGILHSMSKKPYTAWPMFLAPIGVMGLAEAYDQSEHYALNKGLRSYEGQTLDSPWGSISESNYDLVAAGRNDAKRHSISRSNTQIMDTFGTGGDLVFAMHNQR